MTTEVTLGSIKQCKDTISPFLHLTPVLTSSTCDAIVGRNIYFKTESFQKTGSFKARGALNAVKSLQKRNANCKGVVTHSSGNHGQALAWAAKMAGIPCCVVVPKCAPVCKIKAMEGYLADVVMCESNPVSRKDTCDRIAKERGFHYVSSCDDFDVITGQGTVAFEFLKQVPNLDAIFVPMSGGGLTAGVAIAAKAIKPDIKIFIVEPKGKMLERCLRSGERLWTNPPQYLTTLADGLKLQQAGFKTWPILLKLAEKDVFTVDDIGIEMAMKFAFERMKIVIEGASGAVIAAIMSEKMKTLGPELRHIGAILTGGNCDINSLPWMSKL